MTLNNKNAFVLAKPLVQNTRHIFIGVHSYTAILGHTEK